MKRWIAAVLTTLFLILTAPMPAQAAVNWSIQNGTLTISGSGQMANYSGSNRAPWYDRRQEITSVVIADGVTAVGNAAFAWCDNLKTVTIADSVTRIGKQAFWGCAKLTQVSLPDGITSIGSGAFFKCESLVSIALPEGITAVEASLFAQCTALQSVALPAGITRIGTDAFSRCYGLKKLTVPDALETVEYHAFFGCAQLKKLTFPESLKSVDSAAFYGCSALRDLCFLGNAPQMAADAFLGLTAEVVYSVYDESWNGVAGNSYGGNITWTQACFHQYSETVNPPTCEGAGSIVRVCGLCGHQEVSAYLEPTGHTPAEAVQEGQVFVVYCRECGKELSRSHIPGDINDDGRVNNKDVTRLFQYLTDYKVEVVEDALDINADGAVNNKDVFRLFQYLSDWDVEIH